MNRGTSIVLLCALSAAFALPVQDRDNFDVADKDGNGFLDVGAEVFQYLQLRAESSPSAHVVTKEYDQLVHESVLNRLKKIGINRVSRQEVESGILSKLDADLQMAASDEFFFGKTKPESQIMQEGCDDVKVFSAMACSRFTPIQNTISDLTCAGTQDNNGRLIRGTVTIKRNIDAVMTAVQTRDLWVKTFDSNLVQADSVRMTPDGRVFHLKWQDGSHQAEAVVKEKWCSESGDSRVAFVRTVSDAAAATSIFTLDVSVKLAGISLRKIDENTTELTYLSNSKIAISVFPASWGMATGFHEAVDIPRSIKEYVESH